MLRCVSLLLHASEQGGCLYAPFCTAVLYAANTLHWLYSIFTAVRYRTPSYFLRTFHSAAHRFSFPVSSGELRSRLVSRLIDCFVSVLSCSEFLDVKAPMQSTLHLLQTPLPSPLPRLLHRRPPRLRPFAEPVSSSRRSPQKGGSRSILPLFYNCVNKALVETSAEKLLQPSQSGQWLWPRSPSRRSMTAPP